MKKISKAIGSLMFMLIAILLSLTTISATTCYDDWNFSVGTQDITPNGITFNGTYFWVTGLTGSRVFRYLANGSYNSWNFSTATQDAEPRGVVFNGTYFWVVGSVSGKVYRYLANGSYDDWNFSVTGQDDDPRGIEFNGTYFWVVGNTNNVIYRYLANGSYDNSYFSIATQDASPRSVAFNGTYFWVLGADNLRIYRYLANGSYDNWNFDTTAEDGDSVGSDFYGTYFWVVGNTNNRVYRYTNDVSGPAFQSQASNVTYLPMGDSMNLGIQLYDRGCGLSGTWLSSNESGSWLNNTGGTSALVKSGARVWNQTNFTWTNSSFCNKRIGWKIYANDTDGNINSSDINIFYQMPWINSSSNTSISQSNGTCTDKYTITWYQDITGMTNWTVHMPYYVYNATYKYCEYNMTRQYWYKIYNETDNCRIFGRGRNIAATTQIKIEYTKAISPFPPANWPYALLGVTIGTVIIVTATVRRKKTGGYA